MYQLVMTSTYHTFREMLQDLSLVSLFEGRISIAITVLVVPCLSLFLLNHRSSISSGREESTVMSAISTPGSLPHDISRGHDLVVVCWVTLSLALLLTSLRFYIRGIIRKNLGWDDYLILLSIVSYTRSG